MEAGPGVEKVTVKYPLVMLLNNRTSEAMDHYRGYKDKFYTSSNLFETFAEAYLSDLSHLESSNFTHPEFRKVRQLLSE